MCIIIAKPAGAVMPDSKIIENCFSNNPDGAGIMFNHEGKVYGFKGFMSLEAFKAKLAQLEKKYGRLTDRNVVMHFRITTHGGSIAANTHPFPVTGSYKAMRELEWESNLGMAHNGIIGCVDLHIDIKKENVSDTMVFIKRVVSPIASKSNIMKSKQLLNAIWLASGSKLAFLDGAGRLKVLGDFIFEDGVYYSNSTYKHERQYISRPYRSWDDWYDYYSSKDNTKYYTKPTSKKPDVWLSKDDEKFLMTSLAEEYGLEMLAPTDEILYEGGIGEVVGEMKLAFDNGTGSIYEWDSEMYDWYEFMVSGEYDCIVGTDALA